MNRFHFIPILITLLNFNFNLAFAQESDSCAVPNSTPIPVVAEGCFLQDGSNADDFIVTEWIEDPEIFDTTVFLVTAPESEGVTGGEPSFGEFIIGTSNNSSFDFSDTGTSLSYPTGSYKFIPFSYNQDELNVLRDDWNQLGILVYASIPSDSDGNVSLIDLLSLLWQIFDGDIQLKNLEYLLCDFFPGIGLGLAYGLGEPNELSLVSSIEECLVGIDSPEKSISISSLSPIPTADKLFIIFESTKNVIIQLFDISGKVLSESTTLAGTSNLSFDVSNYPSGIYFARISDGRNVAKQKFIVN